MQRKSGLHLYLMISIVIFILLPIACITPSTVLNKDNSFHRAEKSWRGINRPGAGKPVYYRDEAVVLLYHDIDKHECGTAITAQRFASHMRMLAENGFAVVSLADIMAFVEEGKPLPSNAVAITLDDGCASNYQMVFPALQARKWPFAVFVTVSQMGQTRPNGLRRLSWPELINMSHAGVLIGSHTYDGHEKWQNQQGGTAYWLTDRLENESLQSYQARVLNDLRISRQKLELELGRPVKHFAHPFGAYNQRTVNLARQAGYKYIWTTHPTPIRRDSTLTSLGRVSVGIKGTSAEQLKAAILKAAGRNEQ